ncbi:helicase MOV-10 [Sceloporus undulatus]|uniref:helicase MOV-10 n=1 Tax=Sceloporus undulatus TaxID=8520 RepID=UPI001C4AB241|nr:helicase MOV-10 [Sceloporus undulatus]
MPKRTVRETAEIGEHFLQFLKDSGRGDVSHKEQLKAIYNQEFRHRDNAKGPNFSSVLYALFIYGRATMRQERVQFEKVKRKVKLTDQYWRPPNDTGDHPTQQRSSGSGPPPRRSPAKKRAEFVSEKNGIDIVSTCDVGNGKISFHVSPNRSVMIRIEVKNNGTNEVTLCKYRMLPKRHEFTFEVSVPTPVRIPPGGKYEFLVSCLTQDYGFFPVTLMFDFMSEQNEPFTIGRFMSAVANSKLAEQLGPTAPYQPYQAKLHKPQVVTVVDGVPPNDFLEYELKLTQKLKFYKYPPDLKDLVKFLTAGYAPSDDIRDRVALLRSNLKAPLQFNKYCDKFCLLLHLEEIQMEVDIHVYDMENVPMVADRNLLVLEAPGVAENRPSVLRGDHLFVTLAEEQRQQPVVQYKGYVHGVELDRVKLGFSEKLRSNFINKMKFNVSFTFNRLPLRLQHRAAELAKKKQLQHLLFPSLSYGQSLLSASQHLNLYNPNLEKNEEQRKAVYQVVAGTSRPAPYLIFGPPGTGKTVTMVEAIKQVLHCIEGSHVLACAPSNSACDLLCQLLKQHLEKRAIYRMNASSRDYGTVPEDIKPFCNWDKTKRCPVFPPKKELQNYRVIITTLVTAGRLVSADFPPGHFSHVFIDESGHAVETESLVAIAGILSVMDPNTNPKGGQLVLAGDPKQLGPILMSPLAIEHGLGLSLLERLMEQNSLYQKEDGSYNTQFVTKLLRNYRSHPAILKYPNDKFYDGELQEHGDHAITHSYCKWKELVKQGFPIIFHGVCGEDQREGNSPSFFNTTEISVLIDYLKKLLLEDRGKKGQSQILPKEIGVISPYRKQVEKIRYAINVETELKNLNNIKDLKVGSVEEFQGQERRVVLISTVRSSNHYLGFDKKFKLGFLKNPKRFNVAITRAKALLIIVGNPMTLAKDLHWAEFLKYCRENNAYRGYQYVEDENDEDEVLAAGLHSLSLDRKPAESTLGESHIQQQVESGWRHEH